MEEMGNGRNGKNAINIGRFLFITGLLWRF